MDFTMFIIAIVGSMFFGIQLAGVNINESDIKEPVKLCETNEGLKTINFKVFDDATVTCINGAKFTIKETKK